MWKMSRTLLLLCFIVVANGCVNTIPYYKQDIQQGNNLTQSEVKKIKKGMTKKEVVNLLGSPVVNNAFYNDELVYIYTNLTGKGQYTEKRLILKFKDGKLKSAQGDFKTPF